MSNHEAKFAGSTNGVQNIPNTEVCCPSKLAFGEDYASLFDDHAIIDFPSLLDAASTKEGGWSAFGDTYIKKEKLPMKKNKSDKNESVFSPLIAALDILDEDNAGFDLEDEQLSTCDLAMEDEEDHFKTSPPLVEFASDLDRKLPAKSTPFTKSNPSPCHEETVDSVSHAFRESAMASRAMEPVVQPVSSVAGIDTDRALHRACQVFSRDIKKMEASLRANPASIGRKFFIDCIPSQSRKHQDVIPKIFPGRKKTGATPEPFQLPINIALCHNASLEVLDFLVQADPSQLNVKDGIQGVNTLCLALDRRPNDIACLGLLLTSNPDTVKTVTEMHENTPLHIACQKGASLQVVRLLVQLNPLALNHRNASGLLPVEVARHVAASNPMVGKSTADDTQAVVEFLAEKMQR